MNIRMHSLYFLFFLSWVMGCDSNDYSRAIATGRQKLAIINQFGRMFPETLDSISYFTGEMGQTKWQSAAGLFGRYVLVVEIPIRVSDHGDQIHAHGEPAFHLFEVRSINYDPSRRTEEITPGDVNRIFGRAEWNQIVKAHGDFGALGIKLRRNAPVRGFKDYLERNFGSP